MAHVKTKHKSLERCALCLKGDSMSYNRPKSLHKTKKVVKPNLQTKWGYRLCQSCFRTLKKKGIEVKPDLG